MKPKYRAFTHGQMRQVTQLEWNGDGLKYVWVMPSVKRHYKTREYRTINRLSASEVELMQYTGLKDKNGVEIYEGDVLGMLHKKHGLQNTKVVVWDEVHACFDWEDANGDSWPDGFTGFYDEYEVIGNVYENPELLREVQS